MKSWHDGQIVEGKTPIDSLNYSLHYSTPSAWEGVRAYTQADGTIKIWKLKEHAERLRESAKIVGFTIPYSVEEIMEACVKVVEENGNKDSYLRPIAYIAIDAETIHAIKEPKVHLDIYCIPSPVLYKNKEITMAISNLVRSYPQFNMQAKTPSNYGLLHQASMFIKQNEVDDVFLLDNNGYIVEATVSNFFVFKGDVAFTPPNKGSILPGITRKCVAEILHDRNVTLPKYNKVPIVIEKDITKADLYTADCVILCGTYSEIRNVLEIDGRKIGSSESHTYYQMVNEEYQKRIRNS